MRVERERALYGSWYEFFPRSEGAHFDPEQGGWTSGTLESSLPQLDRIKRMGFDVAYLTPIHPIGTTHRKGRNNTLTALEGDPGSPTRSAHPTVATTPFIPTSARSRTSTVSSRTRKASALK